MNASRQFSVIANDWLRSRQPFLSARAFHRYRFYIRPLIAFFGEMHLPEIDAEQIRTYQSARMATVSATVVNHECSCLHQMLKRAGRWQLIGCDYQPLPLPKVEHGRVLNDSEYERLFRVASAKPEWEAAHLFAIISINTTAGPGEI